MDDIKSLPKKILRAIENEFEDLAEEHQDIKDSLDRSFKRIRKNVLDAIGDVVRQIENKDDKF